MSRARCAGPAWCAAGRRARVRRGAGGRWGAAGGEPGLGQSGGEGQRRAADRRRGAAGGAPRRRAWARARRRRSAAPRGGPVDLNTAGADNCRRCPASGRCWPSTSWTGERARAVHRRRSAAAGDRHRPGEVRVAEAAGVGVIAAGAGELDCGWPSARRRRGSARSAASAAVLTVATVAAAALAAGLGRRCWRRGCARSEVCAGAPMCRRRVAGRAVPWRWRAVAACWPSLPLVGRLCAGCSRRRWSRWPARERPVDVVVRVSADPQRAARPGLSGARAHRGRRGTARSVLAGAIRSRR